MFPIELKTENLVNSDYIDPNTPILPGNNKIDNFPTLKNTLDIIDNLLIIKKEAAIKKAYTYTLPIAVLLQIPSNSPS